jgi:hypothetical protein
MSSNSNSIKLLTGNSHPELAELVADRCVLQHPIPDLHLRADGILIYES